MWCFGSHLGKNNSVPFNDVIGMGADGKCIIHAKDQVCSEAFPQLFPCVEICRPWPQKGSTPRPVVKIK